MSDTCASFDGETCFAVCVEQFLWTFIYPILIVIGLLLNISAVLLFRRGTLAFYLPRMCCCGQVKSKHHDSTSSYQSATSETMNENRERARKSSSGVVRFRFSGPGYTFIETMTINSLLFMLTIVPLFFARCRDAGCGWRGGLPGYTLAVAVELFSFFLNDVLHWANVIIVMCYGIQRCCAASGNIKLQKKFTVKTTRYCVGLAFQVAVFKEILESSNRVVLLASAPGTNGTVHQFWHIGRAESGLWTFQGDVARFLLEPMLSLSFLLALCISFTYICLVSTSPVRSLIVNATANNTYNDQQSEIPKPNFERERRMTIVYLAICSAYMCTVILDLVSKFFRLPKLAGPEFCDISIAVTEMVNFSLIISEMSATLMNIFGNRIFRAGLTSFVLRHSSTAVENKSSERKSS